MIPRGEIGELIPGEILVEGGGDDDDKDEVGDEVFVENVNVDDLFNDDDLNRSAVVVLE